MARRKAGDKKAVDQGEGIKRVQADHGSIAIGGIQIGRDLSGSFTIGYTAEQVSLLLSQITTQFQPKPFSGECPYKGLEVFEEEDAGLFFGRERLVEELIGRVKESRTVFITGPSGSGKSSLVRAGLIHALKEGAIGNSKRWLYETMKPGREPLKDLALAFSRLKGPDLADYFQAHAEETDILHKCAESVLSGRKDQRFVLFVDQFEEVFTQVNQEAERVAFLRMLAHAGTAENGRVIVLFAMRSDFVSNCAAYPAVNELLSGQFRQIGAMQPEELVSAMALPARKVGLPVEPELIAQIINDMKGEPGALPLMQFALKELFEARQARGGEIALTLEDYLERGGIQKMLARHADATLNGLSTDQQGLARSIFSGLIEIGRGRQDTRRIALFEELVPAVTKAKEVEAVVQQLADARLVITDEQAGKDTVTIAHERLITAWPWLEKLIDENRDVIALQNEIANDAKEWDDHGRDPSYLYTGARLANAREKLEAKKLVLSELPQTFIEAGMRAHTDELAAAAGRIRRFRILTFGLLLALVAAGFLGFVAQQQASQARAQASLANANAAIASTNESLAIDNRAAAEASQKKAQEQATIARAGELAAQSIPLRDKDFQLSLLLGIEAYQSSTTIQSRGVLLDNTQAYPQLRTFLNGYTHQVDSVAFSPDGKIFASGSCGKSFHTDGMPTSLICVQGEIILWDVATHQPIGQPLTGHTNWVHSVAFSPDGKTLASGSCRNTPSIQSEDCIEGEIILWDISTRQPIGQSLTGHTSWVNSVAFSPDGKTLASGSEDDSIILWDVSTVLNSSVTTRQPVGQPLIGDVFGVTSVAFSPDGQTLASGSRDGTIILWNVVTRQIIGQPLVEHIGGVNSVAFNPDGKILGSGSCGKRDENESCVEGEIILWDVTTRKIIGQPLMGHTSGVTSVAFSPDGKTLASGSGNSEGSSIILWDVSTGKPIGQPLSEPTSSYLTSVAFSPDGRTLASGSCGKLDVVNRTVICVQGKIIWWDISTMANASMFTPQMIGQPLTGHTDLVNSVAFSPDGKTLASGSCGKTVNDHCVQGEIILWDVSTGKPIGQPLQGHSGFVYSVAFSPNGRTLASGSDDHTVILWDVSTHQRVGQPLQGHSDRVTSVAFSPDGKMLASGSWDTSIILWNIATRQIIGQPLTGPISDYNSLSLSLVNIESVAFSPDGKTLASGRWDGTIILWDLATHQMIGEPLTGHTDFVYSVVFSPDGKMFASGSRDGTIILWDIATRQIIGQPLQDGAVPSVAFSPDGKTLASGSFGNTLILWDVAHGSGQPIGQPLQGHSGSVNSVAFSPDGRTLASGSDDHTIVLWDLNSETWVKETCQRVGRNFTRAEWAQYFPDEDYRSTCPQWPLEPEVTPRATPTP